MTAAAPTVATAPVAMYRKSRRVCSAEDTVVTSNPSPPAEMSSARGVTPGSQVPRRRGRTGSGSPGKAERRVGTLYWHPCGWSASPLSRRARSLHRSRRPRAEASKYLAASSIPNSRKPMHLALYEPDIPQNTGTILRLCACLGIEAHIVEPAGFPVTDRAFRRAGMDYLDRVTILRHRSWGEFDAWRRRERLSLVLLTTKAERSFLDHAYAGDQVLLFGRESAGVPEAVHEAAD